MARTLLMVVLMFALTTATAAACDLAGPVPGPGQLFLFDLTTGKETTVPVTGRWLGAGCELSNTFAYDGQRLVWSEGEEKYTAKQTLRMRTADGNVQTLPTDGAHHQEIGLTSTHVYYVTGSGAQTEVWRHHLDDHTNTRLDAPVPGHATLNGATAAWFSPDGKRLSAYDLAADRWILQDQTLAQLGISGDDQGQLFAFDADHAFMASYLSTQKPTTTFRYWTYGFATQELTAMTKMQDPHAAAVADGHVYLAEFDIPHEARRLQAIPVEGGTSRDLGILPHELGARLVIVGNQVVLASYRNLGTHEHVADPEASGWVASPGPDEEPWTVPLLPHAWMVASIIAVVLARRGRA